MAPRGVLPWSWCAAAGRVSRASPYVGPQPRGVPACLPRRLDMPVSFTPNPMPPKPPLYPVYPGQDTQAQRQPALGTPPASQPAT